MTEDKKLFYKVLEIAKNTKVYDDKIVIKGKYGTTVKYLNIKE
jgi:hypothetical protein